MASFAVSASVKPVFVLLVLLGSFQAMKLTNKEYVDMNFDLEFAMTYLMASSTSYCHIADIKSFSCPPCKNLTMHSLYNVTNSKTEEGEPQKLIYLVDKQNEQVIVAFEGTHNPFQIIHQGTDMHGAHFYIQDIPSAIVDAYYLDTYNNGEFRESIQFNLKALVAKYPQYQVIFTGHSLGGALTVVAAVDAVMSGWIENKNTNRPSPIIYTYGQPRIGNMNFQSKVNELFEGKYFRITHHKDLIPHIPPCVINFSDSNSYCIEGTGTDLMWYPIHAGIEIFFDGNTDRNYKVCEAVEDTSCSMQYTGLSVADHIFYMGVYDNCPGDGDH